MTALTILSHRLQRIPRNVRQYLLVVTALGFTIDGGIYSVLLNLYVLRLGYGPEFVGALNSAGLFVFAAISLPVGAVRRFNSRQMLLIGLVLIFSGMLGMPLVQWLSNSWQVSWLISTRVVTYVGLSCFFVHTAPFIMSITKGNWHSRALSLQSAVLALAGFVGGLVGGVLPGLLSRSLGLPLTHPTPYQYPLLLAGACLFPAILVIAGIKPTAVVPITAHDAATLPEPTKQRTVPFSVGQVVLLVLLVRILQMAGVGVVSTFSNVYLDDGLGVTTDWIGVLTAVGRLIGVPVALAVPYFVARWGNYRLVIWTTLLTVLLMLPMGLIPHWGVAGGASIAISSMTSIRYLSFLVFSLSLVPEDRRALLSGAGEMAIGISFALMSLMGGYLITWFGYPTLFITGLLLTLLGTALFWLLFHKVR